MFDKSTYINRRARLCSLLPNAQCLFMANNDASINYADNTYAFRQDSTFLYLFGIDEPNIAAIIDTASGQTTIYGNEQSLDDIIWSGPLPSLAEKAEAVGISRIRPYSALQSDLRKGALFPPPYRASTIEQLAEALAIPFEAVKAQDNTPLVRAMITLRSVKEDCEIEELERQTVVARNMHVAAMRSAIDGKKEYEVRALVDAEALKGGGITSFPTICTVSGQTLHKHSYNGTLRNGNLLLVDAGSESPLHYATDNTRTSPVGGHFSQQQKDIYNIVLAANNAVAEASAPGVFYFDMHCLAMRTIANGLQQLGLLRGSIDDMVHLGVPALFMPHGIGHMLGLDVHDMESYGENLVGYDNEIQRSNLFGYSSLRMGRRLQKGFVVTDEPGIYFIPHLIDKWKAEHKFTDFVNYNELEKFRNFSGIRLEDELLITDNACRIIGQRIPITTQEVEQTQNN